MPQAQGHVGVLGGIFGGLVHGHAIERDQRLALARHIGEAYGRVAQMALGQLVHAEAREPAPALVHRIGHQHGVVVGRKPHAIAAHHHEVVFDVLADLEHALVFEQRLQPGDRVLQRELGDVARAGKVEAVAGAVRERDVAGAVRLKRERHAAKARGHGVEVRRLGVEGDVTLLRRGGDPVFERLQVRDLGIAGVVERHGPQPILHPAQLRRRPGGGRGFLRMRLATGRH